MNTIRSASSLLLAALLAGGPAAPDAAARADIDPDRDQAAGFISAWYLGVAADEIDPPAAHTSEPVIVEVDAATRVTVPPHLTEQEIQHVGRMDLGPDLDNAIVVGVDAVMSDGMTQAYVLIFDEAGELRAELPLREYFDSVERIMLGANEPALLVRGNSGAHFADLWVYRFTGGQPEPVFANGSAAGVELRDDNDSAAPAIWIGVEDWADPDWEFSKGPQRWNVYRWDGFEYAYDEQASSIRELSVEERRDQYVLVVFRELDEREQRRAAALASE